MRPLVDTQMDLFVSFELALALRPVTDKPS